MRPRLVPSAELHALMRDIAQRVEAGDSFEGSVEWGLVPEHVSDAAYAALDPEQQEWFAPNPDDHIRFVDPVDGSESAGYALREGAPVADVWLVSGVYRIGNRDGQGGVRFVGTP